MAGGILCYHLGWLPLGFGQAIMEGFFALSGFLISKSIFESFHCHKGRNRISILGSFWFKRIRRLGPALWVFLIVTLAADLAVTRGTFFHGWNVGASSPFWISNIVTIREVANHRTVGPFGGLWSLAVEEQFYMFFPISIALTLFAITKSGLSSVKGRILLSMLTVCLLSCLGSISLRFSSLCSNTPVVETSYSFSTRAFGLAVGGLGFTAAAFLTTRIDPRDLTKHIRRLLVVGLGVISLGYIIAAQSVSEYTNRTFVRQWAAAPFLASAAILLLYLTNQYQSSGSQSKPRLGGAFERIQNALTRLENALQYFGRTSYSLYLYHCLILFLMGDPRGGSFLTMPAFMLSIACGIASYELVEKRLTHLIFSSATQNAPIHRQAKRN